jgi:hypothetical protein
MIKFFRKIRQNLLKEGKTARYFKYAIGEIVLVVIGILIALQINNWNQQQSDNKKQSQYLRSIVFDLKKQLGNIEYQLKEEEDNLSEIEKLLSYYNENNGFNLNQTSLNYFSGVFDRTTYVVSRATYTELVSTGDIRLISNKKISNAIVVYYQDMQRRELIIQKNNDIKDFVMNPILIRNIGLTSKGLLKNQDKEGVSLSPQLEQTNTNLLDKNRLFEVVNVIKLKWLATFSAINWLKEDKKTTLNIITSINDGLKLTE